MANLRLDTGSATGAPKQLAGCTYTIPGEWSVIMGGGWFVRYLGTKR